MPDFGLFHPCLPLHNNNPGSWTTSNGVIAVEFMQSDPYALPNIFELFMPHKIAKFSVDPLERLIQYVAMLRTARVSRIRPATARLFSPTSRLRPSLCDGAAVTYLLKSKDVGSSATKGGYIAMNKAGQQVLQRSSVTLNSRGTEALFMMNLLAQGRVILFNPRVRYCIFQSMLCKSCSIRPQSCKPIVPRASGVSNEPLASSSKSSPVTLSNSSVGLERYNGI
jgi:hypothetical protein